MKLVVNEVPEGFVLFNDKLDQNLIYVVEIRIKNPAKVHKDVTYHRLVEIKLAGENKKFIWMPLEQSYLIRTFVDISFESFDLAINYMSNMLDTGDRIITQVFQFEDFQDLCKWYLKGK